MTAAAPVALRDEDGAVREDFVEQVAQAIADGDAAPLRALVGDLHEADVGDLIEALDPDLRPRLIELMGARLRLHGADRSRRHRPRGNPRRTAARDRGRGRARARFRRRGRHPRRPAEGRAGRNPRATAASERVALRAQPATIRRTRPAGACRPSSSPCRRSGRSGRPSTTCARRPICPSASGSSTSSTATASFTAPWRSTGCCGPSGRCRSRT